MHGLPPLQGATTLELPLLRGMPQEPLAPAQGVPQDSVQLCQWCAAEALDAHAHAWVNAFAMERDPCALPTGENGYDNINKGGSVSTVDSWIEVGSYRRCPITMGFSRPLTWTCIGAGGQGPGLHAYTGRRWLHAEIRNQRGGPGAPVHRPGQDPSGVHVACAPHAQSAMPADGADAAAHVANIPRLAVHCAQLQPAR